MPTAHPHPWRRDSLFGDGPRRRLDREQRARFRFLLNAHRRARRISPLGEQIGSAMVRRLGVDGQLDPAHETIAGDVGCCSRTVRRALEALKALGLVIWQRRLVRAGWRTEQNLHPLDPQTHGRDVATMLSRQLVFEEAIASAEFRIVAKSRLFQVRAATFEQLDAIMGVI